jgi:hypothetical protein
MNAHPEWLADLLATLRELWPLDRVLNVVMQDEDFWQFFGYDTADGACQILPELIQIHIRSTAEDTEYWHDVLYHEYAHAILAPFTEVTDPTPAFTETVEMLTKRLGGLLDFAVRMKASRRV